MPASRATASAAPGLTWFTRTLTRAVALVLGLNLVLLALLTLAMTVPDAPIVRHLHQSVAAQRFGPEYPHDGFGGKNDVYTECIVSGLGIAPPAADLNPFDKAIQSPRIGHCTDGAAHIQALYDGAQDVEWHQYMRYWHGYTVLSRPLLALVGLEGTRLVVGALLILALGLAWSSARRAVGGIGATFLLLPLVAASNLLTSPLAYSQAISLGIALAAVPVVGRWTRDATTAVLSAGVMGALYNYVDLLTAPAVGWVLAAATAMLVAVRARRSRSTRLRWGAAAALGWISGYAATWILRWVFVGLVMGKDAIVPQVLQVGAFRLAGEHEHEVDPSWGASTAKVLGYWWHTVPTAQLMAVLGAALVLLLLARAGTQRRLSVLMDAAALSTPALLTVVWYEVMKNHSQIHDFFTYRSIPAALGVVLAALWVAARDRHTPPPGSATPPDPATE